MIASWARAWVAVGAWLKRIPLGVWAAAGVALAVLGLYLRGRRLEAELAQAKLHQIAARARAEVAKNEGRAEVHLANARKAGRRVEEIEAARALVNASGAEDERRLSELRPDAVHQEYMKLLIRKRAALNVEQTITPGSELGRITIRAKKRLPTVLDDFDGDEDDER